MTLHRHPVPSTAKPSEPLFDLVKVLGRPWVGTLHAEGLVSPAGCPSGLPVLSFLVLLDYAVIQFAEGLSS